MITLIKRNILVYTRDRMAFFMSFLSVIILLILYQVFLGQFQLDAIKTSMGTATVSSSVIEMVNFWLISGLTTVVSLTSTLGAFSVMVSDKEKKLDEDFTISACPTWKLETTYIFAAVILGTLITLVCCLAGILLFNGFNGLVIFSLVDFLKIIGLVFWSCLLSATIILPFLSFIKSASAFSTLSTIVGTLIGFLSGVYISIGSVGKVLAQIMTWFPMTQMNTLLKNVLMSHSLKKVFKGAPEQIESNYKISYGIILKTVNNHELSISTMTVYIFICMVGLLLAYLFIKKGLRHVKK
ncbi:ABC transporter permease [Lactococcus allomyrinae]|uniref:ABC transporter permease n=1 Tax=Lactococcus allomyrinae TaxID=2419773 RepID=A0A387BIL7_9LACT|nr:ABC transporter permease [Lactococcus allomyrinae]AYG02062.1 ABC transporter permease [Lactococcus allomyrinae]